MKRSGISKLLDRYRITDGKGFKLKHFDPSEDGDGAAPHDHADALLLQGVQRLAALQEKLHAQDRWSLLCVFQAMDTAGKDGTIKHVMSGVNPAGVHVHSFKAPGPEQLAHDFLWRAHAELPERGRIGIFNRSHYEEVLVVRVHPELLDAQHVPAEKIGKKIWEHRLEDIAAFERHLCRQGTVVLKFFLNISRDEQKQRILARIDDPSKTWKFSPNDLAERKHWDDYMHAYEAAIAGTADKHAPWFVVPANHKWFAHLVVVEAMIEALEALHLHTPEPTAAQVKALAEARRNLESES